MISSQSRRLLRALGMGAVLLLSSEAAIAGAAPRGQAAPPVPQARPSDGDQNRQTTRDRDVELRLEFLHRRLNIRQNQERLWNSFANVVRVEEQNALDEYADARDRFFDRDDDRRPTVLERLERRRRNLADRSQRLDHFLGALRPLYAALDTDQRRMADRLFFRPFAGGGPFGEGWRGFRRFGFADRNFDRERNTSGSGRDRVIEARPPSTPNAPGNRAPQNRANDQARANADAGGARDGDVDGDADNTDRQNL